MDKVRNCSMTRPAQLGLGPDGSDTTMRRLGSVFHSNGSRGSAVLTAQPATISCRRLVSAWPNKQTCWQTEHSCARRRLVAVVVVVVVVVVMPRLLDMPPPRIGHPRHVPSTTCNQAVSALGLTRTCCSAAPQLPPCSASSASVEGSETHAPALPIRVIRRRRCRRRRTGSPETDPEQVCCRQGWESHGDWSVEARANLVRRLKKGCQKGSSRSPANQRWGRVQLRPQTATPRDLGRFCGERAVPDQNQSQRAQAQSVPGSRLQSTYYYSRHGQYGVQDCNMTTPSCSSPPVSLQPVSAIRYRKQPCILGILCSLAARHSSPTHVGSSL